MGTLDFYDADPEGYASSTFGADMSDILGRFASRLPQGARVLDLGCGSGRDSLALMRMGFDVVSVDGSEGMCRVAERLSGIRVRNILFDDLDYVGEFDGVWACASLLHVASDNLPRILRLVGRSLRPGGILYMSFKEGTFEGERDGRHYTDMTASDLDRLTSSCGFHTEDSWTSNDFVRGIAWTNTIVRRTQGL